MVFWILQPRLTLRHQYADLPTSQLERSAMQEPSDGSRTSSIARLPNEVCRHGQSTECGDESARRWSTIRWAGTRVSSNSELRTHS